MQMTRHAEMRSIQRYLPGHVLRVIHDFGSERHSGGAISLTLDRESIRLACEDDGDHKLELNRYRGAYVVISDSGAVITAARRMRRFRA